MRKVVFSINMSLDGNCDHTRFSPDDEVMDYFIRQMRDVDTLAYGRKIYELMVPYWPEMARNRSGATQADNEFARAFAAVPNLIVFSRTLESVEQPNTRIVRTDPKDEIARLKRENGGDIHISGVQVPSQLIAHRLVDEFRIVLTPVIAGTGPRFTEGLALKEAWNLNLAEVKAFKSGCVALHYVMEATS
jgi:dihydrofolate reductase